MDLEKVDRCVEILKKMDSLEAEYEELVGEEGWDDFAEAREWIVAVPRVVYATHYWKR